jgi:predicted DCC family thiol-disulfide oxidoreductase YuxK
MTVILFDGVCNLCNGAVQFIIKRDRHNRFYFASLQSPYGQALQQHFGIDTSRDPESILVFDGRTLLSESRAIIKIIQGLGGFYRLMLAFRVFPRVIQDALYRFVARNRYGVFGKTDSCYLPGKDISYKFLDNSVFQILD